MSAILSFQKIELMEKLTLLSVLLFFALACFNNDQEEKPIVPQYRFAFYNVENFFDTLDNPQKLDEEFTPLSEKGWNTQRYQKKMANISSVLKGLEYPEVIGLCEVENESVLKDFINLPEIKKHGYQFVHYESPDMRGIDVAFLYKKGSFKLDKSDYIRIPFPDHIEKDYTSRDILCIEGKFKKEPCYFFINHWPSRYGGAKESEPKRMHVAQYLRDRVDKIQTNNPKASIFIMGDFNDETNDKSLTEVLKADTDQKPLTSKGLYNCSAKQDQEGKGSYNYRGEWNMMDQFIVSGATLNGDSKIKTLGFEVYDSKEIQFFDKRNNMYRPNRTYGGPRYFGGYSDHLPIYVEVAVE